MTDDPLVLRSPSPGETDTSSIAPAIPTRGAWPPPRTMIRYTWVFASARPTNGAVRRRAVATTLFLDATDRRAA